jgi:hypothetical protein
MGFHNGTGSFNVSCPYILNERLVNTLRPPCADTLPAGLLVIASNVVLLPDFVTLSNGVV